MRFCLVISTTCLSSVSISFCLVISTTCLSPKSMMSSLILSIHLSAILPWFHSPCMWPWSTLARSLPSYILDTWPNQASRFFLILSSILSFWSSSLHTWSYDDLNPLYSHNHNVNTDKPKSCNLSHKAIDKTHDCENHPSYNYVYKKLSCRRETARLFLSLNILLSHSVSFVMTLLSRT